MPFSDRSRLSHVQASLSSFVGREQEVAEVKRLLYANRLITLTGPGGCGKTRLALHAAGDLAGAFQDGAWLVEFAPLSDPGLVPQAAASALGLQEQPGRSISDTLIDHLRPRRILLVFDNCEHLAEACARLSESLLSLCPKLKLLATSREPQHIPGEVIFEVPPLSLPDLQPWRSPVSQEEALKKLGESEAVRLFVERAAAVMPKFELDHENGGWVAEICRRLDGMPLAIELAAARLRALSVRQISDRLDDRFRLLKGGSRTASPRQQTLEATLGWSYELLSPLEQKTLQRLAVFTGGFTLEAAEAMCSVGEIGSGQVLDALAGLVDKSLVGVKRTGEAARYDLLESIRQYARQKLNQAGVERQARERHLSYFLKWAEEASSHLTGPEQLAWLARFDQEHDNLRAALEWSEAQEDGSADCLRLAGHCGHFWRRRGLLSEGRRRLETALACCGKQEPGPEKAQALRWAAQLAYLQSDYPAAQAYSEESLEIWQGLDQVGKHGAARALDILGEIATEEGDYETAPQLFRRSLQIFKELGDARNIGDMLMQLAWAAMRTGDLDRAANGLEDALVWLRESGDHLLIAQALSGLGELFIRQGQYERAIEFLEESLAKRKAIGDTWGIAATQGSLGWAALRQGDFERMKDALAESLRLRLEIDDAGGTAWCLEKLAEAEIARAVAGSTANRAGRCKRAVVLFGAASALRTPLASVIDPAIQPAYEEHLTKLHVELDEGSFEAAWREGETMSGELAAALALAEIDLPAGSISEKDLKARFGGLTAREREVAALVAQGLSNREIAEELVLGMRTIETYVSRILRKLGFDSRLQIAIWAAEMGLAPSPASRGG